MKNFDLNAAKRRQTIAELVEKMRIAQRDARLNDHRADAAILIRVPKQIGVWKGGCS